MNRTMLYTGATIGGLIGGYIPVWAFGVSGLSGWSILCGTIGGILGIWGGVVLQRRFGD